MFARFFKAFQQILPRGISRLAELQMSGADPELAAAHQKQVATFQPARTTDIRRKLAAIAGFEFVTSVELTFTLGKRVKVGAEAAIHDDALAMTPPTYKWEFDRCGSGEPFSFDVDHRICHSAG